MSNLTRAMMMGAAGAASGDPVYVDDVFSTFLYTGTSNAGHVITNGIDLQGEGGAVWIKNRGATDHHQITNEAGKILAPSSQESEITGNTGFISSFNSNGFTLGQGVRGSNNGDGQVSWTFRKAPGFFDCVTYTGTGSARTVAHSLGSVPGMILIKCTSHTSDWSVYHRSLGATKNMHLNNTTAADTQTGVFNDTEPTATNFTVNYDGDVNGSGKTYKAYIFAHNDAQFGTDGNESIIKCGTYTGTNTGGLQTVSVGFEPQFVLIKNTTTTNNNWIMLDSMRGAADANGLSGSDQKILAANLTGAENTEGIRLFVTNDGFGWRDQTGNNVSGGGNTFIYMAIHRPHKPPTAGTDVYQALSYTGNGSSIQRRVTNFAVDMLHTHRRNSGTPYAIDRMRSGLNYINTMSANSEGAQTTAIYTFGNNFLDMGNGAIINGNTDQYILEMFKRAPGFFDIVTYEGNGTADHAVPHQLGVVPELVFVKTRNFSNQWAGYTSTGGVTKNINWSDQGAESTNTAGQYWGPTAFTSTNIYLGSYSNTNYNNKPHIGYLFASLDEISKIGRYTGTGNAINVDCGFTAGARFVMIKRTDTEITGTNASDWYYWDSVRGISAGNDPYMKINKSGAEVTNTDYVDPLNAGFTVTSSAPAALNVSGGTYLFLAIA